LFSERRTLKEAGVIGGNGWTTREKIKLFTGREAQENRGYSLGVLRVRDRFL